MGFGDKFNEKCTHKLVFDFGYMEKIFYRQHTKVEKEKSSYRDLRCIQCGKDLSAKKDSEMFNRTDGIIESTEEVSYSELFHLYDEEERKNKEEAECIEIVKKKVYKM